MRRRGGLAVGMAAIVGVFVVATAAPAFAHDEAVSGVTVCSNGDHVITWTISNSNTPLAMHIVTESATLNGSQTFPIVGGSDVPPSSAITLTTTIPGNLTGDVLFDAFVSWPDGINNEKGVTISLGAACGTGTTTTTEATTSTTEATTSTTEATTSTTEATTSTTIESSTTLPSTTTVSSTPIDTEGSTVQTTTPTTAGTGTLGSTSPTTSSVITAAATTPGSTTGALPFTGSSDSGPIIGLSSLVAGAFALVFARRKHQQ